MASRQVSPASKGEQTQSSRAVAAPVAAQIIVPQAGALRAIGNQALLRAGGAAASFAAPADRQQPSGSARQGGPGLREPDEAPDFDAEESDDARPIPPGERAWLEDSFGADLGSVRLNAGAKAAARARSIGARAFVAGENIFLAERAAEETFSFRHLLAHEVAHVIQGRGARAGPWRLGARGDGAEREAEQAASAVLRGRRPARLTPDSNPTIRRQSREEFPVDAVRLEEWMQNPPPLRRTFSLDGILLRPVDATVLILPDQQSSSTAAVFKSLLGDGYTRDLVRRFEASNPGPLWEEVGPRVSGLMVDPVGALRIIDFLESATGRPVDITNEQRRILTVGTAFDPVPRQVWAAMPVIITVYADPSRARPPESEANFLARKPWVLRQLAGMWGTQAETYARAVIAWRADRSAANLNAAGEALSNLIAEFDPYAEALVAIHDDRALQSETVWSNIWPQISGRRRPRVEDIDEVQAVQFVRYAATQPRDFIASIPTDAAARRSLLMGFRDSRGALPGRQGDQALQTAPSRYNAAPLPVRMSSYPPIAPPLFAAATGATTTFVASVRFPDLFSAMSNALGGWFYNWDAIRVPGDDIANLGNLTIPPSTPSGWDVLSQSLSRDVRYAEADLERMQSMSRLTDVFGPPGAGALDIVGLNFLMDVTGSVIRSAIRALTRPDEEFDVPFNDPGLYLVRCIVGPHLSDTSQVAQLRRAPGAAWMPVYAQGPRRLAEDRVRQELQERAQLPARLVEIAAQLADTRIVGADRAALEREQRDIELGLRGTTSAILQAQRDALAASIATPEPGANVADLTERLHQIDLLIAMRNDRASNLANAPVRLTTAFTTDQGVVYSLAIEAAEINPATHRWFVSDLTSPRSGQRPAVGRNRLAPGEPKIDAILEALKQLLESESGYGRGELAVWFPPALTVAGTAGRMISLRIETNEQGIALHAIENLSTLMSIAAVVAAPFTGGGSLVLLMPAGLIGAIPSAYRLAHRHEMGTLRLDLETAMQIVDIATAALQLGEIGAGARALAGAGTRAGLRWTVVEGSLWVVGLGGNGLGMVLMGAGLMDQIRQLNDLPPGLRAARITEILGNAMLQAGIQVGAHLASRGHLQGVEAGVRGVTSGDAPGTRSTALVEPGGPRPAGRSEPPANIIAGLPPDVRRTTPLDIDPNLRGGSVHVEYSIGPNGRVDPGSIRIVAGPRASAVDIGLHAETARTLHAYAGLLGAANETLQRFRAAIQGQRAPQQGSAAWEAQMELAKLDGIIRQRMQRLSRITVDDARAVEVAADIANLRTQLEQAQRIVAGFDPANPRGFIAADSPAETGARLAARNRQAVADNNIAVVTLGPAGASIREPVAGATSGNPTPGYYFSQTASGPRLTRLQTATTEPRLILVSHNGRIYIAPDVPAGAGVAAVSHANNIRAQIDQYPPPRPGHHYVADDGGWQLQRESGYTGPAQRIVKDNGVPRRGPDGGFTYTTVPERSTFAGRQQSAALNQPAPEHRNPLLEAALTAAGIPDTDLARGILRRWGAALTELGAIAGESLGFDLSQHTELVQRAVTALARGLGADGSYIEARYDNFRHIIRDAALAYMLGFEPDVLARFVDNGVALPHPPRSPADQRALYDRLYAVQADEQSKGELWTRYREMRGRLSAEQGGFGDFTRIPIPTEIIERNPITRIDGAIHVPADLGRGRPAAGDYALESKGGSSFNGEQSGRYHANLERNGGQLVGLDGQTYAGVVYLFDNITAATTARTALNNARRHRNIYVAYVDGAGAVQWLRR